MARRKPSQGKSALFDETPQTETLETETATEKAAPTETGNQSATTDADPAPPNPYQVLLERGEASKLSPKSEGKIYFQIARSAEDRKIYLRIHSQDGGGLFSKQWISAEMVIELLNKVGDQPIKSSAFKTLYKSSGANTPSFFAAILRTPEVNLLEPDPQRQFQHLLVADFNAKAQALLQR